MNTIIFLSGCGVGALVCCTAFIYILLTSVRKATKDNKSHSEITAELMRERNALDREKIEWLREIAIKSK